MPDDIEVWQVLTAAVVGFVVGSINPATLIARARGVNLRAIGSGNPGATNTARAMGARTGVLVGVIDVLKGFVPALAFSAWGGMAAGEAAGLAAVLGHIFSPFLRGRGGKGVATTLGAVLGVQPLWAVPMLAVFAAVLAVTRRVGLGAVAGALVLIALGIWAAGSTGERWFGITLGLVVLVRHQANIRAALTGEPLDEQDEQ